MIKKYSTENKEITTINDLDVSYYKYNYAD